MRLYFLLIMLQSFICSFGQIDSSSIKIRVELEPKIINERNEIEGELYITNKGNKSLKLPKFFDLGYILLDDKGKPVRSEEHTSELQSRGHLVCRLLLEKKKQEAEHTHLVH